MMMKMKNQLIIKIMDNQNKITGIVEQIIDKSGTSKKDGKPFTLKQILIREISGNYPQSAVFDVFGDRSDGIGIGSVVDCYFNLNSREYAGKYYNQIQAWKLSVVSAGQPEYEAPEVTVHHSGNTEPSPSPAPIAASELEPKEDDLPF